VKIKMKKLVGSRKLELHIKKKNSGFVMQWMRWGGGREGGRGGFFSFEKL